MTGPTPTPDSAICYGCEHCGCDPNDPEDFCESCDECEPEESDEREDDWL